MAIAQRNRWSVRIRRRVRQGRSRVRVSLLPMLQASIAAGLAYFIAGEVLGHAEPIFAPIAAWACLGFAIDKELRRVAEVALGVALGVGLGDIVVNIIGSGVWQVMVVLAASGLIARFVDEGVVLTTQAGVQSIVIVGLPAGTIGGGAMGRWTDALIGGGVALAIAALWPTDHRKRPRILAKDFWLEFSRILEQVSVGLIESDEERINRSLYLARASQPMLDAWASTARSSFQMTRVSPQAHRSESELTYNLHSAALADRAMRNARVLIRRTRTVVEARRDAEALGDLLTLLSDGCDLLADDAAAGRRPDRAISTFMHAAEQTDPWVIGGGDWHVQSLVVIVRSLVVDLLEACDVDPVRAREILPPL